MIVLLTDFGHRDPFVGVMKCVIASISRTPVIDLVHEIPRQDVRAGAWALKTALPFLPKKAIVVGVVDPGVGTARRAIVVQTRRATFVGPDNGLFTFALDASAKVFALEERKYFLPSVSATFHGRDVFAPVSAHLAEGLAPSRLGPRVHDPVALSFPTPADGAGEIVMFDTYGNAISNVPNEWARGRVRVGRRVLPVVSAYGAAELGAAVAVPSSGGTLEIAINGGDAREALGLRLGTKIRV